MEKKHMQNILMEIYRAYFSGMTLKGLVNLTAELVGDPVILFDSSLKVIAYSDPTRITDPYIKEYINSGFFSYEYMSHTSTLPGIDQLKSSDHAFRFFCEQTQSERIACHLQNNGQWIATVLLLDSIQPLMDQDEELITDIAKVYSQAIFRERGNYQKLHREDILHSLISGKITAAEELEPELRVLNAVLPEQFSLLVFDLSHYTFELSEAAENLQRTLQIDWKCSYTCYYQEHTIALIEPVQLEKCMDSIRKYCHEHHLKCGISSPLTDPFRLPDAFSFTLQFMEAGKKVDPHNDLYEEHTLYLFSYLPDISKKEAYERFCHPCLKKIVAYDRKHGTELYMTFYHYILSGFHMQKTADRLYLHRNTARYRIQSAIEVGNIHMDDIPQLSQIFTSYLIMNYYSVFKELPDAFHNASL